MLSRTQKNQLYCEAQSQLDACRGMILTHYSGLTVSMLTDLRVKLRAAQSHVKVVKNRVFKKALVDQTRTTSSYEPLVSYLSGPIAIIFLGDDIGAGVKVVADFASDNEAFSMQVGFFDGGLLSPEDLKAISSLPSMEVMQTKILGSIIGVHRQLMGVLSAVPRDLVGVMAAIEKTKKES